MKKILVIIIFLLIAGSTSAESNLSQRLSGRIILQVEAHGEAWYINPTDKARYYLGRPADAFAIMKKLALGVKHEYIKSYTIFPENVSGRIILDVGDSGKAYYINPVDKQAYYLGRPDDAFRVMRELGLGIADSRISEIAIGFISNPNPAPPVVAPPCSSCSNVEQAVQAMSLAAEAIRQGDAEETNKYFISELHKAIEYTLNFLTPEKRLMLGNILSGSKASATADDQVTFSNDVYFSLGGYEVPVKFYVKKQSDGTWKLTNL